MLTEQDLHGVFVPIVTPFDLEGGLDLDSLSKLVQQFITKGIHGLVVNGTTGESPAIEPDELELIIKSVRNASPASQEIPVIVGTGTNNTASTVKKTIQAKTHGADAALVVTPYYNRPSQQGIIQHFASLAEAGLPIIVYDIPHRTGVSLELDTLRTIMHMAHVIGLKDSTGNVKQVRELTCSISKPVLCGDDELFFDSLCCGATGGILASANVNTDQFIRVFELFKAGKVSDAKLLFDSLLPLVNLLFAEPNPAPLKWFLAEIGHIRSDKLRLPMTTISPELQQQLKAIVSLEKKVSR
ncbi:4-hydroxy-tetrahydrodipicolinate synthase [Brevibacillus ruminantium]|uniref:4-hydroxy-tetrahydrodipicolinate synthase n=1 Tax=Brevibacillus ruminantium TaxID=2950604 RepID=A0ABY4WNC4_9BACL|nr:4-hydroxy-tetrahydrodipicolinate synthase [Brevibacillus ruminantium]USG66146.1 4-hydroxy-tetrahydrodipicolinate synthase [Brevibacillus ruminantium]